VAVLAVALPLLGPLALVPLALVPLALVPLALVDDEPLVPLVLAASTVALDLFVAVEATRDALARAMPR
jgi:hypothetical protein